MTTETKDSAVVDKPADTSNADTGGAIGGGEGSQKTTIFGEKMPSVAELMGDAEPEGEKVEASEKTDKPDDKTNDDKSTAAAPDDKPKEDDKAKDVKPPDGYVEKAALTETRNELKDVKARLNQALYVIAELKESIKAPEKKADEVKPDPEAEKWKEFKVLSREELKELTESDPTEAALYRDDLAEYKDYQKKQEAAKAEAETKTKAEIEKINKAIDEATRATYQEIDTEVPGIYKRDNGISKNLVEFAESIGIPGGFISILTNPKTIIRQEGSDRDNVLNKGALYTVRLLNNLFKLQGNKESLRKEIEKELTGKFEADKKAWIADIEKKLKGGSDFTSIGDIAPSNVDADIGGFNRALSDAEFAKLSPKERSAYLNG